MLDHFFCIRIAVFSLIGFCLAISGPLYLDCRLESHVVHGARIYKNHKIWWYLAPIAFLLPYLGLKIFTSPTILVIFSLSPLVVLGVLASFCFPPERPHSSVLFCMMGFAVIILLTIVFRLGGGDYSFVGNTAIPFEARLEEVKAYINFWQMVFIYGAAGYIAFAVTWVYAMWFTTDKRVSSAKDKFVLGQAQVLFALIISVCYMFGPLEEAFFNSFWAMSELSNLR